MQADSVVLCDFRPTPPQATRCFTVQHLMAPHSDLAAAASALERVGEMMGVHFQLRHDAGDIVLLDQTLQGRLSPQMIHALREDRPLVTLPGVPGLSSANEPLQGQHQHSLQVVKDLLRQLSAIAGLKQSQTPEAEPGPAVGPARPPELPPWLQRLVLGRTGHAAPGVDIGVGVGVGAGITYASYGPQACMRFDAATGQVECDALAVQHLRLHRELPLPVQRANLQADAVQRGLDHTLWDLGIAAGAYPLMQAPRGAWQAPLLCVVGTSVSDYTRSPLHLDAVRQLQTGPISPSALRRRVRTGEAELRACLQACLLVGVVQWADDGATPHTAHRRRLQLSAAVDGLS